MNIPYSYSSLIILAGGLGSGKTELASNFAFSIAEAKNKPVHVIDLDNIKPYFKLRNLQADYKVKGIRIIAPPLEYRDTDLPLLPPEARSIITSSPDQVIVDVGGDEYGARILGGYRDEIASRPHDFFFVINCSRPYPREADAIIQMIKDVEMESGLKVTALINNTHLLWESTEEILLQGAREAKKVSDILNLPLAFHVAAGRFEITSPILNMLYKIDLYFNQATNS